jgi:hypothetical protein
LIIHQLLTYLLAYTEGLKHGRHEEGIRNKRLVGLDVQSDNLMLVYVISENF